VRELKKCQNPPEYTLDELNGFPRGFTASAGISDTRRAYLMENALVVGIVRRIGQALDEACQAE
jgi:DNA (cytosine-5)-methyltransferase 1